MVIDFEDEFYTSIELDERETQVLKDLNEMDNTNFNVINSKLVLYIASCMRNSLDAFPDGADGQGVDLVKFNFYSEKLDKLFPIIKDRLSNKETNEKD